MFSVHYLSVVSQHYHDSYCDFEGLYFEKIDSCFLPYKKYLEILCCVDFNSLLIEIVPLVLPVFDDNNKQGLDRERRKLRSIFFREAADFSLRLRLLTNEPFDTDFIKYVFKTYKKVY